MPFATVFKKTRRRWQPKRLTRLLAGPLPKHETFSDELASLVVALFLPKEKEKVKERARAKEKESEKASRARRAVARAKATADASFVVESTLHATVQSAAKVQEKEKATLILPVVPSQLSVCKVLCSP